jgi:hypothetical protein
MDQKFSMELAHVFDLVGGLDEKYKMGAFTIHGFLVVQIACKFKYSRA